MLFCPGDRPDRFRKAATHADVVILDLEDAVAAENKDRARITVAEALSNMDSDRTIVRVNAPGTRWCAADLEALNGTSAHTIMLPKTADADDVTAVGRFNVIALCETAVGVLHAEAIAAAGNCVGVLWGGEDLMADLGGRSSRGSDGTYHSVVRQARSTVLLAAAAARRIAIDAVHIAIGDLAGLAEEAADAAAIGFRAKACIHPTHVEPIRRAFLPSDIEMHRAEAVLRAAAEGTGVFTYEGSMVDGPLLRHARAVVAAGRRQAGSVETTHPSKPGT